VEMARVRRQHHLRREEALLEQLCKRDGTCVRGRGREGGAALQGKARDTE
jgi:hypothetical protein